MCEKYIIIKHMVIIKHMLSILSSSAFGLKSYRPQQVAENPNKISVNLSGTENTHYTITIENEYTYFSIAKNCTIDIVAIQNLGADVFVFGVGQGGHGACCNVTRSGSGTGGCGGGMVYGKWLVNATDSLTVKTGNSGNAGISTQNGSASTPYPTRGGNTTVTSQNGTVSLTAHGGHSGTWNVGSNDGFRDTNPLGNSGSNTGLDLSDNLPGGAGGLSQAQNGIALSGSMGNKCPLPPFATGYYDIPFGSGGGGGSYNTSCEDYSAPFAGSGHCYLSQANCAEPHQIYNYAIIPGVPSAKTATASLKGSKANDSTYYYGRGSSNSGAGGGSSQAQGWAGRSGTGICVFAVKTNQLF